MLRVNTAWRERGDTLIEVTIALAILSFVLLGSTAIASTAFRTGQTARERTIVSEAAQGQMEALRTFRDNHTWAEFRYGSGATFQGIEDMATTPCQYNATRRCFHMVLGNAGLGTTDWVPATGSTSASVPTSVIEISTSTPGSQRGCGYDFELHYSFTPLGGSTNSARNQIVTRLANLKYDPGAASPDCPI
jgi:prepilin-type N-terminal cleavage/methylation domain-containing protein